MQVAPTSVFVFLSLSLSFCLNNKAARRELCGLLPPCNAKRYISLSLSLSFLSLSLSFFCLCVCLDNRAARRKLCGLLPPCNAKRYQQPANAKAKNNKYSLLKSRDDQTVSFKGNSD